MRNVLCPSCLRITDDTSSLLVKLSTPVEESQAQISMYLRGALVSSIAFVHTIYAAAIYIPSLTRDVPAGYEVEHRIHDARREMRVYGLPSGHYFKSWRTWGYHLTVKLEGNLQNYDIFCAGGWRDTALDAAIIVGLLLSLVVLCLLPLPPLSLVESREKERKKPLRRLMTCW
jgi:hypothetical protein